MYEQVEAGLPDSNGLAAAGKSADNSRLAREYGKQCFRMDDFTQALYHFTHSISFAENGSLDLAYAYGNRSAVLYRKGYFNECLQDIERALENPYPEDKKLKLLDRKNEALKSLHIQNSIQFHDPTPTILTPNVETPSVSNSLQIQKNPEYGRFIVATREIAPGEVLVVEDPYCHIIHADSVWLYCNECSEFCLNMIPCTGCSVAMYCSEECKSKSYTEYHRYECDILQTDGSAAPSLAAYCLCARMAIKCILERKSRNSRFFSKQYKKIQNLMTHQDHASLGKLKLAEEYVQTVFNAMIRNSGFFEEVDLDDKEEFVKAILLRNYLVADVNTIKISNYDPKGSSEPFGSAVYAYFSLFNHACSNNVGYSFYGKKIVLRALRKISRGKQCFVNYGCISYKIPKKERQEHLRKSFYFTCKCRACEENWPTEQFLLPIPINRLASFTTLKSICDTIRSGSVISKEKRGKMLNECFGIAEHLRKCEPCFEFSLLGFIYDSLLLGGNQSIMI